MTAEQPGTGVPRPTPRPSVPRPATPGPGAPVPAPVGAAAPRPAAAQAPRQKPDPRPMRLGLAAGAIAALSVMAAGLVRFPSADPATIADDTTAAAVDAPAVAAVQVEKRIRYVQLKPGQKAPPGARVIDAAQPTPRVVVTRIQAPAVVHRRVVTRTRQSGRP
ncbi:MAG: hypothetical protein U0869_01500 [Chloroflexota bacterium]